MTDVEEARLADRFFLWLWGVATGIMLATIGFGLYLGRL